MAEFKYTPEAFEELAVTVEHMDLDFQVYEKHTRVLTSQRMKTKKELSQLELNSKKLEIHEVSCDFCSCSHELSGDFLVITFDKIVPAGQVITVKTDTTCKPTHNILEGLYYDETPEGCPPTQITQCQQWGFQRMVPCFDEMILTFDNLF